MLATPLSWAVHCVTVSPIDVPNKIVNAIWAPEGPLNARRVIPTQGAQGHLGPIWPIWSDQSLNNTSLHCEISVKIVFFSRFLDVCSMPHMLKKFDTYDFAFLQNLFIFSRSWDFC